MDELLTVYEVASILKAKPGTVRNWIREGKLKAYKAGKRLWRVRQVDLQFFLQVPNGDQHCTLGQRQEEV